MPTEYTLTYYNRRGWGEPARFILSYAGAVWKDNRVPFEGYGISPLPDKVKEKCKYGQVPVLEFAGKKLVQSVAISRYLAQEFRLTGKDRFEAALCDEYVDTCKDVFNVYMPHFMVQDEEKKAELFKEACSTVRERFLNKFNQTLKENGGYLVGKSLTWADIYVAFYMDQLHTLTKINPTEGLPALARLIQTVFNSKGIKEYIEARPDTLY